MFDSLVASVDDLAARIPSGASLTMHKGDEPDVPLALAEALVRRGVTGLHVVTLPTAAYPASGMFIDILIGAGCVDSVETSGISMHELGAAPRFSAAVKAGQIKVLDATCPAVYAALQAGAKGQPFAPLWGLVGSDIEKHRDDYRVIDHPFVPGQKVAVLRAINTDFAVFHAPKVDSEGNVWVGRDRDRVLAAHAAACTLVTVEEHVEGCFFDDERLAAGTIPAVVIDAVAVAPGACAPMRMDGSCDLDVARAYRQAARTEEGFAAWLAERGLKPVRSSQAPRQTEEAGA